MAIIKVAKGGKTLTSAVNYAGKEGITIGKDVADDTIAAIEEMKITKEIHDKTGGRIYKHYIQSFAPNEVNAETAQEIGLEFAKENFKGYEVFIGTHADKEHIHNHFIVNSVNFQTGEKFNVPKSFLQELKKSNDEICISYGLQIIKKQSEKELNGEIRTENMKKYQILKSAFGGEKKSYVLDAAVAVKNAVAISRNKAEFLKNMQLQGYETNWTDSRKHVTFKDKDSNKVRLANLEKTFNDKEFSKEGLEREFKRNLKRGNELDSEGKVAEPKQGFQDGIGEQSAKRTFDGVYSTIREIEERTRTYSRVSNASIGEEQQESRRIEKEQSNTCKVHGHENERTNGEFER